MYININFIINFICYFISVIEYKYFLFLRVFMFLKYDLD